MDDPAWSENPTRLAIVMATYNECATLPILVSQLHRQLPHARMIVIDDNSPDGTGRWCDEFSAQNSFLQVFHRHGKLGLGSATVSGLKRAIDMDSVFVATMDADLSHDPRSLKAMYELFCSRQLAEFGVMIGSRYVTGGKIEGWPWYRHLSSAMVNLYSRIALGLHTKDNTSAFRIYRATAIKAIDLDGLQCPGFAYLEELLVKLKSAGVSFIEYPIIFQNRTAGKSKVSIHEIGSSLVQIARLGLSARRGRTALFGRRKIDP